MYQSNYVVWGAASELISAYKKLNESGEFVADIESQEVVRRAILAKYEFFYRNGLLLVNPFTSEGELIDRDYRVGDFSKIGYELCQKKVPAWLKGKGSKKMPPDMSSLVKALAEAEK